MIYGAVDKIRIKSMGFACISCHSHGINHGLSWHKIRGQAVVAKLTFTLLIEMNLIL
jgi:hypothetical protein